MEDDRTIELDFQEIHLPKVGLSRDYTSKGICGNGYPVNAYFINGKKIASYGSINEASNVTGVSKSCIENILYYDEYKGDIIFTFSNQTFEDKMKAIKKAFRIIEYDLEGNLIRAWKFISEAAKAYNVKSNDILRCVNGIRLTVGGRIFLLPTYSIQARLFRINYKHSKK